MVSYLLTSESVSNGHPDKVADQISDCILDACLKKDLFSRVACETLVTKNLVVLAGEITTHAQLNYEQLVRQTIQKCGYIYPELDFDYHSCQMICALHKQSSDIAQAIDCQNSVNEQGAGDQGLMFGYACDETPELMPLPIMLAHRLVDALRLKRESQELPYLRPDAKTQVTIAYDELHHPLFVHTLIISTQHTTDVSLIQLTQDIKQLIHETIPAHFLIERTKMFINPSGQFIIGGPAADTGLTGRKLMVDTYGGIGRHGGGAFSGKDPSKVDRSASYAARYIAKNIVAAKLAKRCEIQLAYAIGVAAPISLNVHTFGTGTINESHLTQAVRDIFPLKPYEIIQHLKLKRPIYYQTASGGHFGRHEPDFTWEKTDLISSLLEAVT